MNNEEFERLKKEVVIEILNLMPEVIGNLMTQHAEHSKLRKEFYTENSQFKEHGEIVSAVIQRIESEKLGQNYEDILKKAIPQIQEQIKVKCGLDLSSVTDKGNLNRDLNLNEDPGEL